jgi:uncharacterized protein YuzE
MKFHYYPETDSLYIDFSSKPSASSTEVAEGVVIDYGEKGNITGIDIDNASQKVDLENFSFSKIPVSPKISAH